ncbi:MAG: hypothetical protein AB1472_02365 [Candidatus Omnitrophota bacterium]
MIVPMKKIALIMQAKDASSSMMRLRKEGIVHIEHQQPPKSRDLTLLYEELGLLNRSIEIISQRTIKEENAFTKEDKKIIDFKKTSLHIVDLVKRIDYLEEYAKELKQKVLDWQLWGDFDPVLIERLKKSNIYIKFYQIPEKELKNISEEIIVKKISIKSGMVYCLLISKGKNDLPFKEIELPKTGLNKMKERLSQDEAEINELKKELDKTNCYYQLFLDKRNNLKREIEFQEALNGMGQAQGLVYLVGYAPVECEQSLLNLAKKEKWGIFLTQPGEEDNPPVLLRNSKWVSLISPVYKLMEVVPGYRELDVSPIFLLFLALFFGMIIGDAGYGLVYFILTFFAQRKYSQKVKGKQVFFLFYLFSSCAIMWGFLSGTFFGQEWYLASGFKALTPALNNTKFLMALCFLLGAIQLSLAHTLQALKKLPSLEALADVGFICLLWVGFLLAKMFILEDPFPYFGKWLVWAGVLLIIFFVSPRKNLFRTIGAGLGTLALGIMGNFGDVVSYIRLFAVGLAGVAVADSVNMLAAGVGTNIIAKVFILFIGHSINIVLGPISVLVHGIRLNVLEFSLLHGNVTWSGLAYKPLRE